jgi:multidrug efflux system outer membrane protein
VAAARGDAGAARRLTARCCCRCRPTWPRPISGCVRWTPNWRPSTRPCACARKACASPSRRFELGDIGEFDLSRARTELSTARAEAIGVQRQRASGGTCAGGAAGQTGIELQRRQPAADLALPLIPAGLPSSLLERRPDIASAQRTMEAANARIGVARSAMFPALNISAAGGGVGTSFADVFKWSSRSWLLGAALSMPLIDGGRNRSNIVRSEARWKKRSAPTARACWCLRRSRGQPGRPAHPGGAERRDRGGRGVARRSADLAQKLYDAGRSSYLELLDAQRNQAIGRAHRGAAARRPRDHHGGADPRARRRLG